MAVTMQRASAAALRLDRSSFFHKVFSTTNPGTCYLHNWHIDAIAEHLRACENGDIRRLIINVPPRSLKSTCVTIGWPAWLLGHNPSRRIIAASYTAALSIKHSQDCRLVMQSDWYGQIFPQTLFVHDQNQKHKFVTTQRGFRLATSVGGAVTGEGGDFLIVDDPHNPTHIFSQSRRKAAVDWFDQTFSSRLDDKEKGVFVIVMQRLHENDLTGHLLDKGGDDWHCLQLPAIAENSSKISCGRFSYVRSEGELLHPGREGVKQIDNAKNLLGSYAFAAQYQQNPVPEGGGMVKEPWINYYLMSDIYGDITEGVVQSWDTAIKAHKDSDYTVCTTWWRGRGGYYLLDVLRERMEYPALRRAVMQQAERWGAKLEAILIEDKASGQSLLQDLRRETSLPLIAIVPLRDKVTRLAAVSPLFESGKVLFPEDALWLAELKRELLTFPSGSHDDQIDSCSQYLNWARVRNITHAGIRQL